MNFALAAIALIVVSGAAASAAQTPFAKTGTPLVTVGCINRGQHSGSLASTPGAPPATPETAPVLANTADPTNTFVLAGARPQGEQPAADGKPRAPLMTYRLEGDMREFEKHNGHRVEVTGTVDARTGPEKPETKSNIAVLRVQSMKMISAECPAGPDAAKPE
jgi:hypothetical protein